MLRHNCRKGYVATLPTLLSDFPSKNIRKKSIGVRLPTSEISVLSLHDSAGADSIETLLAVSICQASDTGQDREMPAHPW